MNSTFVLMNVLLLTLKHLEHDSLNLCEHYDTNSAFTTFGAQLHQSLLFRCVRYVNATLISRIDT